MLSSAQPRRSWGALALAQALFAFGFALANRFQLTHGVLYRAAANDWANASANFLLLALLALALLAAIALLGRRVFAAAIDSFLHSAEANFSSPSAVAMQRQTAEGTKTAMIAELAKDATTGKFKPTKLEPTFSGSALEVASRLELMMIPVVAKLEEVLNKLPKKPKP